MNRKFLVLALVGLLAVSIVAGAVWAKGGATPLVAIWTTASSTGFGVFDDGNNRYENGIGKVQCYFGVSGKDVDVVTYNSGRKLHFKFDPNNSALQSSGLSADFLAESDLFGINYFGRYRDMGIGTTAQVQADLEFYVGRITYELDYPSLAVMRISENTWRITSDPLDIPGNPGFTPSDEADLNVIRRRSQESFGQVNMPIRFEVTIK